MKGALAALGIVLAGWLTGGLLMVSDHTLIGIVIGLVSIPVAVAAWIAISERI